MTDKKQMSSVVDPWFLQERLMCISGQFIAGRPQLNSTGILYVALVLEEVGELCSDMADAIFKICPSMFDAVLILRRQSDLAGNAAIRIRDIVAKRTESVVGSDRAEYPARDMEDIKSIFVPIADSLADIMVVTAGASIAMGLKGDQCFSEVSGSNLSKANPITGIIDKDPSGKWIKGVDYVAPDLVGILASDLSFSDNEGGHVD